jgi:integrase
MLDRRKIPSPPWRRVSHDQRGKARAISSASRVAIRLEPAEATPICHMLRHFFVTTLIQSGTDMKTTQTLAGHHSVTARHSLSISMRTQYRKGLRKLAKWLQRCC